MQLQAQEKSQSQPLAAVPEEAEPPAPEASEASYEEDFEDYSDGEEDAAFRKSFDHE